MSSERKETSFDDFSRGLEERTGGADRLRAERLGHLAALRRAKDAGLRRERERLARKYGEEHPRVAETAARITVNASLARDLDLEAARARVEVPRVDAKGWAVHGHVRDRELKPVAGLTVALYDARANWVESEGFACTDAEGYFRIETRDVGAVEGPLFLRVLTGQAVHLYADPNPLTPLAGAVEYRAVHLKEGAQACAPPVTSPNDPVPGGTGPAETGGESGGWVVRGRVTDERGEGVDGLTVSLFDKDLLFDDRLGQTETAGGGYYAFTYGTEEFRDLVERRPDIYLKVIDARGRTVYTSKEAIRYEAGRVEIVNARVGD
ncbi:MAG TPA: hypothetical protein VER32_14115 [Pyrinomonadaceae bacterium]|nr:hypothetical protein [Pyrinomonadaceae bacterium]